MHNKQYQKIINNEIYLKKHCSTVIDYIYINKNSILEYIKIHKHIKTFLMCFNNRYYSLANNIFLSFDLSDIKILAGAKKNTKYTLYKELNTYLDKTTHSYVYNDDNISRWFISSKDAEKNSGIYTNSFYYENKNKLNFADIYINNHSDDHCRYILKTEVNSNNILMDLDYLFSNGKVILMSGKYNVEIYEICCGNSVKIKPNVFVFTSENKDIIMNGPLYFTMSELKQYAVNCNIKYDDNFDKNTIVDKLINHIDNPLSRSNNNIYDLHMSYIPNIEVVESKIITQFVNACINDDYTIAKKLFPLFNNYEFDVMRSLKGNHSYTVYREHCSFNEPNITSLIYKNNNISIWNTSKNESIKHSYPIDLFSRHSYKYIYQMTINSEDILLDLDCSHLKNSYINNKIILMPNIYHVNIYKYYELLIIIKKILIK